MKTHIQKMPIENISPLLQEKAHYALGNGKQVRPWFMEKICQKTGLDFAPLEDAAQGIEWIHTASLLHDDIIDNDDIRRGKKSFFSQYGKSQAVLFGDYFFLQAMRVFQQKKYRSSIFPMVLNAVCEMTEGQLAEIRGTVSTKEEYVAYALSKTARLFEVCAQIPLTYYGKINPNAILFAQKYGLAYQIADDLSEEDVENDALNIQHFIPRKKSIEYFNAIKKEMEKMKIIPANELPFIAFE